MTFPHIPPLPHQPVSPNFNHEPPPDANPHHVKTPAGGQVTTADPKFLGEAMSRERRIKQVERERALRNS
jgi:hypothetical protein